MEDNLPKLVRELSAVRSQYDLLFTKSQKAQRLFEERDVLQRQQINSLNLQNEDLKLRLQELRQTVKKNYASQLAYNEDVKELEKLSRIQEARIIELEDQVLAIGSEKTRMAHEIALKSDDNEYLKQDIARLKQKLDEDLVSRSEYDIGITKFEQLQSSIDENMITKVKYNQLEDNYRDLKETFNQKVQAVSTEKEIVEQSLKSTREAKELLSVRLADNEANLEKSNEKLATYEREITAYRLSEVEQQRVLSEKISIIDTLLLENKSLQDNFNKSEFTKTTIMTQLGTLKQQHRKETDQVKLLNQAKQDLQTTESELIETIRKISIEKTEQARKISNLENQNEQLKLIVHQMTDKAKYFEMQILSLHQAVVESEDDVGDLYSPNQNRDSNLYGESPLLSSSDIIMSKSVSDSFNSSNTNSKNVSFGGFHRKNEATLSSSSTFIPPDL